MARSSYTDELADWVTKRNASRARQDRHVVAFLAVRADVEAAIGAGYSVRTVWEHLHETGKVACRYESFLRHVRLHIRQGKAAPDKAVPPGAQRPAGFTFNPRARKEDLL